MKKAKVLLICPNLKGMKDGINRIQPSLGLMIIGQKLLDEGHIVKIHDTALEGWNNKNIIDPKKNRITIGQSDEEIRKLISDFSPDIVAISVLFSNFLDSAHCIARLVKEVDKNIKVVLGGNHISHAIIDYRFALIDKDSMHVRLADEAICIGKSSIKNSYLNSFAILSAAEISNSDAIHPGAGFFSENYDFASMVN